MTKKNKKTKKPAQQVLKLDPYDFMFASNNPNSRSFVPQ